MVKDLRYILTLGRERVFPIRTYVEFFKTVLSIPFVVVLAIVIGTLFGCALLLGSLIASKRVFLGPRAYWCRWFAWYPVKLMDGKHVWFRTIERRGVFGDDMDIMSLEKMEYTL